MNVQQLALQPQELNINQLEAIYFEQSQVILSDDNDDKIKASCDLVAQQAASDKAVYGINTGFGLLANTKIAKEDLGTLQKNLILSHCTGVGEPLNDNIVGLILVLKACSLATGYSGVRKELIDALLALYNHQIFPMIPAKGSVGASGDLAPLAHLTSALLGIGKVRYQGEFIDAKSALDKAQLKPFVLSVKEGLGMINGTQVSTALALAGFFTAQRLFGQALIIGGLSLEAVKGSHAPFNANINLVRNQTGQQEVAQYFRQILSGSEIWQSHQGESCQKVQDPYCLRCQPQVMGAILDNLRHAGNILLKEANGVSDNPLVFTDTEEIISGGNFHAEPVGMVADLMAIAIAEIGSISERRTAMLIDKHLSGHPPFLVQNSGLNSGFMIAQVTAAALVSENKSLAYPSTVDSIPTSANQEDHVSMATYAARRLQEINDNLAHILAIEALAATQALDFLHSLKSSLILEEKKAIIRQKVPIYDKDRYFASDINIIYELLLSGALNAYEIL